jgi:hypothetical protein
MTSSVREEKYYRFKASPNYTGKSLTGHYKRSGGCIVGHGMPWIGMQWRMQYTGALDLYGQDWKVSSKKNLEPCNVLCLLVESKKPAYAVEGAGNLWKVQVCMGQPDYSLWNFAKSSLLLVPSLLAMDSFYLCPSKRTAKKQNSKFKIQNWSAFGSFQSWEVEKR